MAAESAARRAGRLIGKRRRARTYQRLEWPALRAEILNRGGIGPSPDYDSSDWRELGLYREHGRPPDIVAQETFIGRADLPPWQGTEETGGDPDAMMRYLRRSRHEYQEASPDERKASTVRRPAHELERIREARGRREEERVAAFGTRRRRQAEEHEEHARRMREFIARARAQHRARREAQYSRPARGFYTDDEGEVHPITSPVARSAGRRYAARRAAGTRG